MDYFYVQPEVAGELGANTVMDSTVHPPRVDRLHYQFTGWLGDVLLESFPCFIATEGAKEKLQFEGLTGVRFGEVEISTARPFNELYPERELPRFVWIRIEGKPSEDDFGIASDARLVVSERALKVLKHLGIAHAIINEYPG